MKGVEGLHLKEGEHRQMGYAEDFKRFIEEHKDEHLLKRFKELEKRLEGEPYGTVLTDVDLAVKIDEERSGPRRHDQDYNVYFKVQFGEDDIFFVKRERLLKITPEHNSINEARAALRAETALQGIEGVKVVNPQLAFKNKECSYFVSRWVELPELGEYLSQILYRRCPKVEADRRYVDLLGRKSRISEILSSSFTEEERRAGYAFADMMNYNAFYDEDTDTIVLFDLHTVPTKRPPKRPQ
jgi:hypothetical protein